jgi:hypothetical protein
MELPREDVLRWIVRSIARLRSAHGEAFATPVLVQPTGDFFPDAFAHDAASVERLLRRMMTYSPLAEDLGIELAFLAPEADHAGGCGSAACGSGGGGGGGARKLCAVDELEDGYRLRIAVTDVSNPEVLTAALARAIGELVLHEAGDDVDDAADAEIAAAACGLGVILTNGAAVWAKSCGGLRMAQATALPVDEAAVVLALFAAIHGVKRSAVVAHLHATQREAYDLAEAWAESNPELVAALRDHPALLEGGLFSVEPARGMVGRWLHKRKVDKEQQGARPTAPAMSEEKRRRLEEARALVDEVLDGE